MKRKGLIWQIRSDHVADHILFIFFGNKFNMCINDLQGSYEGYAQEIALKKEAKLITNGIMRCSLSTTAYLSGKTKSRNIHRYEIQY